jgi:hypothetical protein
MAEIKVLSLEAIPEALLMAERYRLLNEPDEAESICLDILAVDAEHQEALITLLLAHTDKFRDNRLMPAFDQSKEIVARLGDAYCKSYYLGVIFERRAKYHLKQGGPGAGNVAHGWLVKAMNEYREALTSCDPGNQKAVLRLNSCVRLLNNNPDIKPDSSDQREPLLDSFDTPH